MGDTAIVTALPDCQFPHTEPVKAAYDARTNDGRWAYVCEEHFHTETSGQLGTGKGQTLYVAGEEPPRDRRAEAAAAILANDWEAFEDAVGDDDPMDYL
jgi:hypothetical protein